MSRVKYVCAKCGSDDILFDAYATWNVRTQQMEVANTYDKGHFCNKCEEECSVDEVAIEELESSPATKLEDLMKIATPAPLSLETGPGCCFHRGNAVAIVKCTAPSENNPEGTCETVAEVWPADQAQEKADGALLVHWFNMGPKMLEFLQHLGKIKDDDETIDFLVNHLPDLLDEVEEVGGI